MYNLTGIYWIKNESKYLPEYIEFHLLQGFDHFIFYDNKSTDKTAEILLPYIKEGLVELRFYPPSITYRNNFWLMQHCINEQRALSKWIHFHAIDERVFCIDGTPLPKFLKSYEQHGGLCVGWKFFNSNNHVTKPKGLVADNYTQYVNDPKCHIKTIIQPLKTKTIFPNPDATYPSNPHNFAYVDNFYAVDENFVRIDGPFASKNSYTNKKILNHHYITMSKEEHQEKYNKGVLDFKGAENRPRDDAQKRWDWVHNIARPLLYSDEISKYSNTIINNLKKRYNKETLKYLDII